VDLTETNKRVIEQFRAGGQIQGMHRERLVLLTTTGARTGTRRTTPMMFHRDGDRIVVIASNSGARAAPSWYTNLVADPQVTVEVGDETFEARAIPLEGADRERTWTAIKAAYPFFAEHERKAARTIPIVELRRSEGAPRS
jgi:deazaflavin-dependent oxidoreductase (nitroreductase family)